MLVAALAAPPGQAQAPAGTPQPAAQATAAAPATQHRDALRLLGIWLDAQRAHDQVPAVSAAVVVGQNVVWRQGYGHIDAAGRVPAAADSIYSICSISKLFTAVAVMQLWEQGRFSLDDDISQLLPEVAIQRPDADSGPVTVRLLLSHAAGLPREADAAYWTGPDFEFPDRSTLLQRLRNQAMVERAGGHHQYSNLGMALLGDLVAARSGQRYEDHVVQHVLAPLQMTDTRPLLPRTGVGQRLATGFGARQRDGSRPLVAPFDTRAMVAAAGYTSTVDDLARFAMWQLRLLQRGGQELLKVSTLREMQRVQWSDPDGRNSWGLGFAVTRDGGQTMVSHSGWCPGYRSALTVLPGLQLAVVSMVNTSDAAGVVPYARQLRQLMTKGLKLPVAATGPGAVRLEDYAGRYQSQPWASETVVVPWGDQLAAMDLPTSDPAGNLELLKPTGPDRFRRVRPDGTLESELVFERDAAGNVTGWREWSQRVPRVSALAP